MNPTTFEGTLTQDELAEVKGISRRMVQKIESRALKKVKAAIEREAAEAGLSVRDWLFEGLPKL